MDSERKNGGRTFGLADLLCFVTASCVVFAVVHYFSCAAGFMVMVAILMAWAFSRIREVVR